MPKVIAAFNMTLDGNCDHTTGVPDAEVHQHFTDLLNNSGTILYGRTTYQLMEDFWPPLVSNPGDNKAYNDFALSIDNIEKVLFSRTIKSTTWKNSRRATKTLQEEIAERKANSKKDILIGSKSLIIEALKLNLVDEFQLCVHPVVAGCGPMLFEGMEERLDFKLAKTRTFAASGVIALYLQPKF